MITTIQQRATGVYDITVRDSDGALVSLAGCELVFQARASVDDADITLEKRTDLGIEHAADQGTTGKGLAVMTIDPGEVPTAMQLRYGLWLIDIEDNQWPLIERGIFIVKPSVVDVLDES